MFGGSSCHSPRLVPVDNGLVAVPVVLLRPLITPGVRCILSGVSFRILRCVVWQDEGKGVATETITCFSRGNDRHRQHKKQQPLFSFLDSMVLRHTKQRKQHETMLNKI